ncbi:MAG: hypothetical protein HZC19_03460 [Candidatus Omnitrophica bacterium]|nr:hypothetical protein [Candidatus Omnitrophota bacterium]
MKNIIWPIVILIIGLGIILEARYTLVVDSPVVAKIDRLTGDAWIVNSGIWRKVEHPSREKGETVRGRETKI